MTQRFPYKGLERKLVIAFDIGTTYSGASYCVLDPGEIPKIHGVNRYPTQEHVGGDSKIPSILYYDANGQVAAIGAEALRETTIEAAEENEWTKVEWFKLHLKPASTLPGPQSVAEDGSNAINEDIEIPPLSLNKSATTIFSDFLKYLFLCTRDYIIETHANGDTLWAALKDKVHFILSHPNGWEGPQQTLMRQASIMAGLIPDTSEGHDRVEFVTEGEASLHYCVSSDMASGVATTGSGIIIVDAGGGTVDLSTYAMTASNTYQEIASPNCVFQGSVYITRRVQTFLKEKFQKAQSRFAAEEDIKIITECFDKTTKLTVREGEPAFIKFGTPRDKDADVNIKGGKLKLESEEIAALFQPAVDGIIEAIERQRQRANIPVVAVFLVGGFAASSLLFKKLQNHFKDNDLSISRPDSHTNKAVADGAISYYIDHFVSTRIAKFTYGVWSGEAFQPHKQAHNQRLQHKFQSADGLFWIGGCFDAILRSGTSVSETKEFRSSFAQTSFRQIDLLSTKILCYRGECKTAPTWLDEDQNGFQTLCTIKADATQLTQNLKPLRGPLGVYYRRDYDVVLSFGLTELKAQLSWIDNGVEKWSPAMVVYNIPN